MLLVARLRFLGLFPRLGTRAASAASAKVLSTEVLFPSSPARVEVKFTGWDVQYAPTQMAKIWYFKNRLNDAEMKKSFRKLLDHYPIVAGRWVGPNKEVAVHPAKKLGGVPFSVGETATDPATWEDLLEEGEVLPDLMESIYHKGAFGDWLSPTGVGNGNPDSPLLTVRVTHETKGPGSWLAVIGMHSLHDGAASFNMMSNWGKLNRGLDIVPPTHDRLSWCSDNGVMTTTGATSWDMAVSDIQRLGEMFKGSPLLPHPPSRHNLTTKEIQDLLASVNSKLPSGKEVKQNDVLCAWYWIIIMNVTGIPNNFGQWIDMRDKVSTLKPMEEGGIFGNVLHFGRTDFPTEVPSLTTDSLAKFSLIVRESIKQVRTDADKIAEDTRINGTQSLSDRETLQTPICLTNHSGFAWQSGLKFMDDAGGDANFGVPAYYFGTPFFDCQIPFPFQLGMFEANQKGDGISFKVWLTSEQGETYKDVQQTLRRNTGL